MDDGVLQSDGNGELLTSSFYTYNVYSEITVSIPKILLGGNASKLTLF